MKRSVLTFALLASGCGLLPHGGEQRSASGTEVVSKPGDDRASRAMRWRLPWFDPGPPYLLDGVNRRIGSGDAVECDRAALVSYRGSDVRFTPVTRVAPPFVERLAELERLLAVVAEQHYGRAPRRVRHVGTFACRPIRGRAHRISEHALGNAIDVSGFEFGALPRSARAAPPVVGVDVDLPWRLRRAFTIDVRRDWKGGNAVSDRHAAFLRALFERLEEERVFRGMVAPSRPRHEGHFHFDQSPWRYVLR